MTVDARLTAYARAHWSELVVFAAPLADEPGLAEQWVTHALAQLADSARLPAVTTDDELGRLVRRRIVRACVGRSGWWAGGSQGPRRDGLRYDVQVMEILADAEPVEVSPEERVRRALRRLPRRQRAAVVLRARDGLDDSALADLLGCSRAVSAREHAAGLAQLASGLGVEQIGASGGGALRTERLVAAAVAATPPPAAIDADDDPLPLLQRRADRLRRQRTAAVAAGAVVVLAGFGAAFTVSVHPGAAKPDRRTIAAARVRARASAIALGINALRHLPHPFDEGAPAVPVVDPVLIMRSPSQFVTAVAAGGGRLWTIVLVPTRRGSLSYVVVRDPLAGGVIGRQRVPSADNEIGYGDGRAWVWSSNTASRRTVIASVDGRGSISSESFTPSIAIQSAAFTTSGRTWLAEPSEDAVRTYDEGFAVQGTQPVAGPRFAVPVGATSIVVASRGGIRELPSGRVVDAGPPGAGHGRTRPHGPRPGPVTLLAPAPGYGVWIGRDRTLTYQPSIDRPVRLTFTLPHRVFAVVGDPAHGVYVATHSENPLNHDPYLAYYSAASLRAANPQPMWHLDGALQVESMVADPAGGVAYSTNTGAVFRWDPAG